MALEANDLESRPSRASSSSRRRSINFSSAVYPEEFDNLESESASEAGDIGDRALHSQRYSSGGRPRLSDDDLMEIDIVAPVPDRALLHIPDDALLQSYGPHSHASTVLAPPESLPTVKNASPLSAHAIKHSNDKKQENKKELPWLLDYTLCLIHLAVFGILGVLTRYLLQKLFGPGVVGLTSDENILYLDLPSNMVGSFLMGWWGVVFKGDIIRISDHLAIGLTTGYLGSLTTFSGWNQQMLNLSVEGKWAFAVIGFLIGLFLAAYSIIFGIETARGFKRVLKMLDLYPSNEHSNSNSDGKVDCGKRQFAVMAVLLLMLGLLWGFSGALEMREFHMGGSEAQLWLACMVGPLGVWTRWFLARFNGLGIGKAGLLKWLPFGTLIANVSAACIMAALATIKKAVNTATCNTVAGGIQLGLMGCLSTVSTFIAEFEAMRQSQHPWRAYAYALTTLLLSFSLGTLIYSVPVWVRDYN